METIAFNGFTPKTIQFLNDLKENNYKEWFDANKGIYESELLSPFKQLVTTLSPSMHAIDPNFELRPHRVLSRIYRDVRFSKNKDPYKTCLWMSFQQPTNDWKNYPGFFMELNETHYFYGMGLYQVKKKIMDELRERIAYQSEEFKEHTQPILDRGFTVDGEMYKRTIPNDLSEYFQPWIQRKSVYVFKKMPIGKEVFSPKFAEQIREDYLALEWLYNFFKDE